MISILEMARENGALQVKVVFFGLVLTYIDKPYIVEGVNWLYSKTQNDMHLAEYCANFRAKNALWII